MKKLLILLLLVLIFQILNFIDCQAQKWRCISNSLSSCKFIDDNTGYAVGNYGTIIKTTDGGANWEEQNSGTYANLHSVFFINSNLGYVAGDSGKILKTQDGGNSWYKINNDSSMVYKSIYFTDKSHGWAIGEYSGYDKNWDFIKYYFILKYNGTNFALQDSGKLLTFNSIHFTDNNTGYIAGEEGIVLKTTDGGIHWENANDEYSYNLYTLNSVYFVNSSTGYAVSDETTIIKTTNAGETWEIQSSGIIDKLYSVYFIDVNTGFAVGEKGNILKTTDGGINWINNNNITDVDLFSVHFIDNNNGFIVGEYGTILKTTDAGNSWLGLYSAAINSDFYSVAFPDNNTGIVVGSNNTIIKSNDGGNFWKVKFYQFNNYYQCRFYSVAFANKDTGFAYGYLGLFKTENGGENWKEINNYGGPIYFTDSKTGYMLYGGISKTTDGGLNWTILNTGINVSLYSFFFLDANTGYAVGYDNMYTNTGDIIIKTTDGGNKWMIQERGKNYNLINVFFINSDIGYVISYDGNILKTDNGGNTWTNISNLKKNISSVCFTDINTGYAVGDGIYKTTDGGISWNKENCRYNKKNNYYDNFYFHSVYFNAKRGIVLGNNGTILILDNYSREAIKENNQTIHSLNIYPNPSKSITTIKYTIQIKQMVSLKIYDITGKEIKSLVNETKDKGEYSLNLNADGLNQGLYFLKLQAGSSTTTEKLIIL